MQQILRCSCLAPRGVAFIAARSAPSGNAILPAAPRTSSPILRRHLATVVDASASSPSQQINSTTAAAESASADASTSSPSTSGTPNAGRGRQPRSLPDQDDINGDFPSRRTPQPLPPSAMDKAQTIHLPNIVFRLVRNSPKEANNPFIATFRVPVQLTKPDIVSYLWQVYGLKVTSISTIIEMGEKLVRPDLHIHRRRKSTKKAIVGLEQPFWFPETRSAAWLEDHFEKRARQDYVRRRLLPVGDGGPGRGRRSWRWRGSSPTVHGLGSRYSEIMRRITERRKQQEAIVGTLAKQEERSLLKELESMSVKQDTA